MPWTGQSFIDRHNHGLTPAQGTHAAHMANAILRSGAPEGLAIAVANKNARHMPHRDDGGMVPTGQGTIGVAPTAANQTPTVQGILQRFSQMQPEQLRELIPRLPGQMQQLAQRVLQQKQMMPQQAAQQAQQPTQALPQFGVPASPQPLPQAAPVQPIMGGQPPVQAQARGGQVAWPVPKWRDHLPVGQARFASGGGMRHSEHTGMQRDETVPILAAGGEFVVSPEHVARLGRGDVKDGHKWLDDFVVTARKHIIRTMSGLKPPVKS